MSQSVASESSAQAAIFTRTDLEGRGFVGFASLLKLKTGDAPAVPGVYAVLRQHDDRPQFLDRSCGGHFKGKDPTVPVATLEDEWVDCVYCVYIGKASTSLRRRLGDFCKYGNGRPVGHQGGRLLWQLADAEELVVAWKSLRDGDARVLEARMIAEFRDVHGQRPFANLKD